MTFYATRNETVEQKVELTFGSDRTEGQIKGRLGDDPGQGDGYYPQMLQLSMLWTHGTLLQAPNNKLPDRMLYRM